MNMQGFDSVALAGAGQSPCYNFLFTSWTLDDSVKTAFACLGTVLMGMLIQLMTKLRSFLGSRYVGADGAHRFGLASLGKWLSSLAPITKAVATVLLYGSQTALSYLIMLVAMTYSVELFASVAVGLTLGYACFLLDMPPPHSTDPCCSAMDESTRPGLLDDKAGLYTRLVASSSVQAPLHGDPSGSNSGTAGVTSGDCCSGGLDGTEVSVHIN